MAAAFAISSVAQADETPLTLIRGLAGQSHEDRARALRQLQTLLTNENDRGSVRQLVGVLKTADALLQEDVVNVLKQVAWKQPASFDGAVPDLAAVLPSLKTRPRFNAIHVLGFLRKDAADATNALLSFSRGEHGASVLERAYSAAALARINPDDRSSLTMLCNLSRSSKEPEAHAGLGALLFSESKSTLVTSTLRDRLSDADVVVRTLAAKGLWKAGGKPSEAVPHFRNALQEPAQIVRTWPYSHNEWIPTQRIVAANALRQIGAAAKEAVPELSSLLSSDDPVEQLLAAKALGAIGPGASSAAAALQSLATSENEEVQNAAKEALAEIVKDDG